MSTAAIKTSVDDVLARWSLSKFFRRSCCMSEKAVSMMVMILIAIGLAVFAALQIVSFVQANQSPSTTSYTAINKTFELPGLLVCMPYMSKSLVANPQPATIYSDPRLYMSLFNYPNYDPNCCLSSGVSYFTACTKNICSRPSYFFTGGIQTYGSYNVQFQCLKSSMGHILTSEAESLWLPYFLNQDFGILAKDSVGQNASGADPSQDYAYNAFANQYVYWPVKLVMTSFIESENMTDPALIYFGMADTPGSMLRMRSNIGWGLSSVLVQQYIAHDVNGKFVPGNSGFVINYDQTIDPLPWTNVISQFHPRRNFVTSVGFVRVHVKTSVTFTAQAVLITYTTLATTLLAIISSSTVLLNVIIGPGEYDPTGLLNKIFYRDVPTLRLTKSTVVFKIGQADKEAEGEGDNAQTPTEKRDADSDSSSSSSDSDSDDSLDDESIQLEEIAIDSNAQPSRNETFESENDGVVLNSRVVAARVSA